jgi:uroporphyrinogen decarboxylase
VKETSRSLITKLIENRECERIPWTFDFGACRGIQTSLLDSYKKATKIKTSLARCFNYDIWIALDPDRIHHDRLKHVDSAIKMKIPLSTLQGCIPLSKNKDYEYACHYSELPKDGFFDAFGLYYHPWPDNPEYYHFLSPLEKTEDTKLIKRYPVPVLEKRDTEYFKRDAQYIKSMNKMCAAYSGSLYEWSYYLRGRERIYFDYYDNPDVVDIIVKKIAGFVEYLTLKNLECGVDILCFYDDLGYQNALQINPDIFRKYYKPYYKKIWKIIKQKHSDRYIFLHACGNVSEIIPDLIECGLDILHPLQPETMDIYKLTRTYSKDLLFWGTMSNQRTLTKGTKEDIYHEVKDRVRNIASVCRLILGSSNTLGKDVPVENINYFRDACEKYCDKHV